jgi:hypothetical protein
VSCDFINNNWTVTKTGKVKCKCIMSDTIEYYIVKVFIAGCHLSIKFLKKSFPDIRLCDFLFRFDVNNSLLHCAQTCQILSNKSAAFASPW